MPTSIEKWAERYAVPIKTAKKLQTLMRMRHRQGTRACNGDPHCSVPSGDKSKCSQAWSVNEYSTIDMIDKLMKPYGIVFDPGTGLWGSIMKDGRYLDDVPAN